MPNEITPGVTTTGTWIIVPDYDLSSRQTACSLTNTPKRPGDVGVFRPALPVGFVVEEGYFDVSQLAIEEGARILGWRSPEEVRAERDKYLERANQANLKSAQRARRIKSLEAQLAELKDVDLQDGEE